MEWTVTVEWRDKLGELHRAQLQIETGFKRLEALVSSIKISLSGSKSSSPSIHASRAAFAPSRCCSAACAVFISNVMRRRSKKRDSAPTSVITGIFATSLRRKSASASMRPDLRSPPCPFGDVALLLQPVKPSDRARRAHPKPFRAAWGRERFCSMASADGGEDQ
jgi:hypothetical protein